LNDKDVPEEELDGNNHQSHKAILDQGDITTQATDAIINAANSSLLVAVVLMALSIEQADQQS